MQSTRLLLLLCLVSLLAAAGCKTGASAKTDPGSEEATKGTTGAQPLFETLYRGEGPSEYGVDGCVTDYNSRVFNTECGAYRLSVSRTSFEKFVFDKDQTETLFATVAEKSQELQGVRLVVGEEAEEAREEIRDVRWFERGEGEEKSVGVLGFVHGSGGYRIFTCATPHHDTTKQNTANRDALDLSTCFDKTIALTAAVQSHLAARKAQVTGLAVAGEPVEFADDCVLGYGEASCEFGSLSWSKAQSPGHYGSPGQKQGLVAYLKSLGGANITLSEMSCTMPAAKIDCYGIFGEDKEFPDSKVLIVIAQATDASGQAWSLMCVDYAYEQGQSLAHPCGEVFSVTETTPEQK